MDQAQRLGNSDSSNQTSISSNLMPNVLFREIHKNAFLKRHSSDRRTGFPRKSEKVWVVFCVHDDVEPFLEIYPDQKVALTHKPEWFASLSNALHVSPTICGHEDEFEFAVTLSFQVVRLSAPSWDSMMEWVETIRNKLRELKVLCPKENLYSKMPEQKQPLLPTRDPNSPLPLPPEGPSTLLPGVELVHLETRNNLQQNDNVGRHQREANSRNNNHSISVNNNNINNNIGAANDSNHDRRIFKRREVNNERQTRSVSEQSQNSDLASNVTSLDKIEQPINLEVAASSSNSSCDVHSNKTKVKRAASVPQPTASTSNIPSCSNITVIEVSTPSSLNDHSETHCPAPLSADITSESEDDVFVNPVDLKPNAKIPASVVNSLDEVHYEHVFLSIPSEGTQVPNSSDNTPTVNSILLDVNKYEKPQSSSILITPSNSSHINSSQDENVASTSCLSSNSVTVKEILINNSTCVNIGDSLNVEESGKSNENGPLSHQIQSKLEKVNISGFIPRVPAKSVKPSFKPVSISNRETNMNSTEVRRAFPESQPLATTSADQGVSKMSNADSSKASNVVAVVVAPAYSQVKKIHKLKTKNVGSKIDDQHLSQRGSPVFLKKKMNDFQVLEVESSSKQKPDNIQSSCLSKNQSSSCDGNSPKASGNKRVESGNINLNIDVSKNPTVSNTTDNDYRIDIPPFNPSTSGNKTDNSSKVNITKKDSFNNSNNNHEAVEPITASVQPAVGVISVEDIPLIGGHQRRRRRSTSSDPTVATNAPALRGIGGADRIRINVPSTMNPPARETQRNESEIRSCSHTRLAQDQNCHVKIAAHSSRLTLREQQVLQLKKEMLHPGGVRLQLRRKDCNGSIAFVDVLNEVWVAGWKQKEHPLLYNALHIGDQLVSIGEVVIRSSAEAQKLIRNTTSLYIEFIIRRVPFGNVFALQRNSEGQSLGIVQEGNTAEIKDVIPNSIAARQGLTTKTPSCDGLSLTTWFLTEINGRPLNLFFKDNEVRDRLNSVGKEISILVQPHDFIKQIKKQLKNIRGYKDYIVQ